METDHQTTKTKLQHFTDILFHPISLILMTDLLVYGIFIPSLGFYWDDIDFVWFYQLFGTSGLARYFSIGRPVLGLFYQLNMSMLGVVPWHWQVFSLLCRWICAVGLYFLIRQLWENRKEPGLIAALVFLLFPGFSQQPIAIIYGHIFIVLGSLFYSLGLSLYVIDHKKYQIGIILVSVLLAAINVFAMEYFFMLELLRPLLFWVKLYDKEQKPVKILVKVIKLWAPYFVVFLAAGIWRTFFFKTQTEIYHYDALTLIRTSPWLGIKQFVWNILNGIWLTVIGCWKNVFTFPGVAEFGKQSSLLYLIVMVAVTTLLGLTLLTKNTALPDSKENPTKQALLFIELGIAALLLGGIPFWVTGLEVSNVFPNDRFSLSFILGSSLIFIGVFFLVLRNVAMRRAIFILLIALAAGLQVRYEVSYQRDWKVLQRFMEQMLWRMPSVDPGTVIFSQDLPLHYYSDLSISGPVNLAYDQGLNKERVPYAFFYPTVRKTNPNEITFAPDQPIIHDYSVGNFYGNTSQSVTIFYDPPACLRIIDPEIESDNLMIPQYLRATSTLSNSKFIKASPGVTSLGAIAEQDQVGSWCYYFEKADLARQQRDWQTVTDIAKVALTLDDKPNDPAERLPFIEGFAHTNQWQQAEEQSQASLSITPAMKPVLCKLWQRINAETPDSSQKEVVLVEMSDQLSCSALK